MLTSGSPVTSVLTLTLYYLFLPIIKRDNEVDFSSTGSNAHASVRLSPRIPCSEGLNQNPLSPFPCTRKGVAEGPKKKKMAKGKMMHALSPYTYSPSEHTLALPRSATKRSYSLNSLSLVSAHFNQRVLMKSCFCEDSSLRQKKKICLLRWPAPVYCPCISTQGLPTCALRSCIQLENRWISSHSPSLSLSPSCFMNWDSEWDAV